MDSKSVSTNDISKDYWDVPVVGTLSTAEYRKLRRLLHDLGRRNIYMRYKYVARFYHSGMLEKMIELLNTTSDKKRKRSDDGDLPDAKRKVSDGTDKQQSDDNNEDDSALTDHDSNDGDSSDEAEAEEDDDEDEEQDEDKQGKEKEENSRLHFYRCPLRCRHHVSMQTDNVMTFDQSTQTDGPIYLD